MLFFPERVALAGIIAYVVLFLLAPLEVVYPMSWEPLAYIGLCYGAFYAGCLIVAHGRAQPVPLQLTARFTNSAFWGIAALGAAGMLLRFADKFLIRGMNAADLALESRKVLEQAGAGWVAAFGALLFPFCFVPLMMWWARPRSSALDAKAKWIAVVLFALPAIDALLVLSRSLMLVALAMMFFSAAFVLYQGRALHPRLLRPALLGVLAITIISVLSFSTRLSQMELDQVFSILNSAYGFVLTPTAQALRWMSEPGSYIGNAMVDVMPLLQYYLHGLFEFGLLWQRPDAQEFQYGMQHFAPYFKVLGILGLSNYSESMLEEAYYRAGVFTTFFGPLWIDFGWLGPLAMGGFGVFCSYCAALARKGVGEVIPLYAYLCVVLFFMPVTNLIVNAQGMYILNALLVLWVLGRHSRAASAVPGLIANRGYER